MKKRSVAAALLACLTAVDAWQSFHYTGASIQRPLRSFNTRTAEIVGSKAAASRSSVVVASSASIPADSCDPFNPEFCEPLEIPAETQPKFDVKRFVKLTTLFGAW